MKICASTQQQQQQEQEEEDVVTRTTPQWDPIQQIYVGGVVPENAEIQALIQRNGGYLRLFGYGSLCWNPGTGALAKSGVVSTLGRTRGYKRCWAQKSTDHRGRPEFPGIVCTLLSDREVEEIRHLPEGVTIPPSVEPTMTEGVIYLIPPDLVEECLEELDFREKGGYARDIIEVQEDETGETHEALLYRGTPDNPAIWKRALLDLPFAAAIISIAEGPSGENDFYLNSLDHFLSETHNSIATENDDTTSLANMARYFQAKSQLFFLFGSGSNQHNQLLLNRPNNAAMLNNGGEDSRSQTEIILCTPTTNDSVSCKPVELFAGGGHSGLLTEKGDLYLWGWNENGQCANCLEGGDSTDSPLPVVQPLSSLVVASAALGFSHTLVIERDTGIVYAFGNNERGQVTGQVPPKGSIQEVIPRTPECLKGVRATAVAAGLFHSAVLTDGGELITFGSGESVGYWKPNDGSRLVSLACGRKHTIVSDDQGRIWTMGENKYGQLGRSIDGKKYDANPALVEGIPIPKEGSTMHVACGWSHCVVLVENKDSNEKAVFGWGRNDMGQLGLGTRENLQSPVRLFDVVKVEQISCGSEFTLVVSSSNEILGCGWNEQYVQRICWRTTAKDFGLLH